MSSNGLSGPEVESTLPEEGGSSSSARRPPLKKRKLQRACDGCRRRKQRCDGPESVDRQCTNCMLAKLSCSYEVASTQRAPPKGYVESLEHRVERLEAFITQHHPNLDIKGEFGPPLLPDQFFGRRRAALGPQPSGQRPLSSADSEKVGPSPSAESSTGDPASSQPTPGSALPASPAAPRPALSVGAPPSTEDILSGGGPPSPSSKLVSGLQQPIHETAKFKSYADRDESLYRHYMGNSSPLPLLYDASGFKHAGHPQRFGEELILHASETRRNFYCIPPWEEMPSVTLSSRAPHEGLSPSERQEIEKLDPLYYWPDDQLALHLINLYFEHVNACYPLLHLPTFLQQFDTRLWETNAGFARVCYLVFAVGSSFVHRDDARVRMPHPNGGLYEARSAGWVYYHAFSRFIRHRSAPTQLYDLQISVLLVHFLQYSMQPIATLAAISEGLRFAQNIGLHRHRVERTLDPVENEMYRRAFWCLYVQDCFQAAYWGRPVSLSEDNFDSNLPHDCDDEFWVARPDEARFQQPTDRPSSTSCFIALIGLAKILASILTQLYAIKPSKRTIGDIVHELDERLAKWHSELPSHAQWDINQPDPVYFLQSSHLHSRFFFVTMLLHRPYLPSVRTPVSASRKSFTVCVDAANRGAAVGQLYFQRTGWVLLQSLFDCYTFGLILLIATWGTQSTGLVKDPAIAVSGVERCIFLLTETQKRYGIIMRGLEILQVLIAPRVDYFAESLSRRHEREQRLKEAKAKLEKIPDDEGYYRTQPVVCVARRAGDPRAQTEPSAALDADLLLQQAPAMLNPAGGGEGPEIWEAIWELFGASDFDQGMGILPASPQGQLPLNFGTPPSSNTSEANSGQEEFVLGDPMLAMLGQLPQ